MKKKIFIIISILIVMCLCAGVVVAKTINLNFSQKDLTEQDKELKTKIAEISDTRVDFRHNKQETFENQTYDISFKKFNSENSEIREIIYANDFGDEFKYEVETGKLCEARIISKVVEKNENSIDIETAHKIAVERFPKKSDISQYTQIASKEMEKGYFFWYKRYIGKYETVDGFSMTVGYDGAIVTYHDTTDSIDWDKLDIDEKYIDTKIQEFATQKGITKIKGDYVCMYQGKVCILCSYGDEYTSVTYVSLEK